jgi:hypothetical protein
LDKQESCKCFGEYECNNEPCFLWKKVDMFSLMELLSIFSSNNVNLEENTHNGDKEHNWKTEK